VTKLTAQTTPEAALRTSPQQNRGQERVKLILDVAESLLVSRGYEVLTTNRVAAEAGISIGSLYHFFEDKVAILEALIARYNEAQFETLKVVHADKNASLEAYVDSLLTTLVKFSDGRPGLLIAFSHAVTASPKFEVMETAFNQKLTAMMGAYYRQRNPKLTEKKAALVAWTVIVIAEGFLLANYDSKKAVERYKEVKKAVRRYLELYL
jgi:AcrR family transcriptional regulator